MRGQIRPPRRRPAQCRGCCALRRPRVVDQLVGVLAGEAGRHFQSRPRLSARMVAIFRPRPFLDPGGGVADRSTQTLKSASDVRSRPWVTKPRALSPTWPESFSPPERRRSVRPAPPPATNARSLPLAAPLLSMLNVAASPSSGVARSVAIAPLFAAPSIYRVGAFGKITAFTLLSAADRFSLPLNPVTHGLVPGRRGEEVALRRSTYTAGQRAISLRFRKFKRHDRDRHRPRPPDPRQPRQPHGRGRCDARGRQHGPRGGAVGRVDRRARSGRAARRR